MRLLPVLLLAACKPAGDTAKPADSATQPDTAGTDGTTPDGWPDEIPACALSAPLPTATATELTAAWAGRPELAIVTQAMRRVQGATDATGCPSLLEDPCGEGTIYTGDCTVGKVSASGTATGTGCDDGGAWIWSGFSVSTPDWAFAAEGSADFQVSGDVRESWDVTATLAGFDPVGTWTWTGEHYTGGVEETRHQVVTGAAGDACLDEDLSPQEACPEEPSGWTVIQGDHVAVVLWDGDSSCDGCGRLFIDGEETGAWCR